MPFGKTRCARDCSLPEPRKVCYVSFDDGANWQKLQLNLPVTPIHDLMVHANDLAVATHGRAFWILDDITPVARAGNGNAEAVLYRPRAGVRVHYPDGGG